MRGGPAVNAAAESAVQIGEEAAEIRAGTLPPLPRALLRGGEPAGQLRVRAGPGTQRRQRRRVHQLRAVHALPLHGRRRGRFRRASLRMRQRERRLREALAGARASQPVCALSLVLPPAQVLPLVRRHVWHLWRAAQYVLNSTLLTNSSPSVHSSAQQTIHSKSSYLSI